MCLIFLYLSAQLLWWEGLESTWSPYRMCPNQSVTLESIDLPYTYPLPDKVTGERIVCDFDRELRLSSHMPHTMQQLYMCVSLWNGRNIKILRHPPEAESSFVEGFLPLLQSMGVDFREDEDTEAVRPVIDDSDYTAGYRMHAPQDATWLRQAARSHLGTVYPPQCPDQPRITILNRADGSGRHLDNTELWKSSLQPLIVTEVPSMDGKTFAEQVQVMANSDLLISPHGAQLTSIPFLPACAMVIEIFPLGYFVPEYFGSLAVSSGHVHRFITPSRQTASSVRFWRRRQRGRNVCVAPQPLRQNIVPSIMEMVEEWRECCRQH